MSSDKTYLSRDRDVTRQTHALFLRAMLQTKVYLSLTLLYFPAYFLMYVFIPLQVAYTLQSILNNNFANVHHHLYVIIVASVAQLILQSIAAWAHNRNGLYASAYVQREIFANYIDKDYEFYSDQYVGALGEQAAALRESVSSYSDIMIGKLFKHATVIIGGTTVLFLKTPLMALITVVCMVAILSYTILSSNYRIRYRRDVSDASSKLAGVVGDALSHGTTVKSFATEAYEASRLESAISAWNRAQLTSWDSFIPANAGRIILNGITLVVLLALTSHLYQQGSISIAIVILVQLYMVRLIATTIDIADFVKQYEQVMGSAYRAILTMDIPKTVKNPDVKTTIDDEIALIELKNVSLSYGSKKALTKVSLAIEQGRRIGLVGYSGSGKTTLSKLIVRFMDPTQGSIQINGTDIREFGQQDLRKLISYVPQEPLLFHRTVYENIAYGRPEATKEEVIKAAELAYVDEFVKELSDGYETLVGERGIKLSGGQRQRVAIARAILKNAPVIVLDEATSALDSRSEHLIQEALWNLMKDRTALVIAHRLSTIQRMDEIVVLNAGKIIEQGSHAKLLKNKGIYARLWEHQSGGYIDFEAYEA